ncbi:MAG TPA: DMT family transporter [Acidimicrobiia bacterium]|nr:DMT family transporter [Acidimicrobiia bacterium]
MARRPVLTTAPGTRPEAFGPREWGLLAAIALMWGSSFLWIAEGLEHFSPPVISLARLLLGAAGLAVFPGTRARVERADWPRIGLLGLVWMAVPLLLFPIAQQWVDSSIAGAINGSMPLFSAALAALLLRRAPGRGQALGLAVGFAGVLLVTLSEATGASGSPLGIGLLMLATVLYAVAFNLAIPLTQRYGSLPVLLRAQLVAIAVVLPFGLWGLPSSEWDWQAAGAMVLLGVFGSGVAFVASTALGARAGPTRGAIPIYFLPVVAMALGVAVRHERVGPAAIAGVALVIVGAWLSSRREA